MYVSVKQGDTFRLECTYTNDQNVPTSLTAAQVTPMSVFKDYLGQTIANFTVTLEDQVANPGMFYLGASSSQTALWKAGVGYCDIRYQAANGDVSHSDTFGITVLAAVTV